MKCLCAIVEEEDEENGRLLDINSLFIAVGEAEAERRN